MAKSSSISKTAMWILMALLFVGLGGFGAVNLSGNLRTIGTVGDKPVSVDSYYNAVQQELQAVSRQTGRAMSFQQAQELGLDRAVLQQLVRDRALDHEATQMGLSVGDETLRDRIVTIPAFQGIDGSFDRDAYADTLRRSGLTESEFENNLREETARQLLQGAIVSGVEMPASYAQTLVDYVGEQRNFTWALLDETTLETPVAAADDATLRAFFDENADSFTLPATKKITYALLTPTDVIDQVEVAEDALREAYDQRSAEFNQPERRLVERLVFADEETANQAAAALEVNGTTFETLVEDRGLALQDVDLGDVGKDELAAAADAVFGADVGAVVGPFPTDLGPALFRVNGVLPAQNVTFEEAEATLRDTIAADRAVRLVEAQAEDFDDRLAGGTTLEQLVEETSMTLGQIDWTAETQEGIAAYADFREAAAGLAEGDFPQISQLDDGSIYAMRLDESLPLRPAAFDDVEDDVRSRYRSQQLVDALTQQANAAKTELEAGTGLAAQGFTAIEESDQTRDAFIQRTPTGFMAAVFDMDVGEIRVLPGDNSVAIVQLDAINAATDDEESQTLLARLREQQNEALARNLFTIFANDTVQRAVPNIDPRAVSAVNVNFQ
ncbi:peptidylprolyl isomerase [Sulfitobacter sp. S190]|uniref:peptidylprolyl isomerase n=1 Tax=Sulfitobacter sp. S190 TaxID=2867022 RepID=UPI0021A603E4|nr:peptidylprolyl isomerase [Sulfitobacter sp. S190]UWR23770.1 SurA N-terminal domain-containing protein [Sulfitobacter sp. S190]